MSDPIVDRVDAMVRRRRSFVASSPELPEPLAALVDDDDVPLLTEIVDINEVSGEAPGAPTQAPMQPMLDALAADLGHAIEDRLGVDLPELVEDALARLHADLRQGIARSVESATRDFLARRQQLRLPFPDRDAD